MNNTNAKLKLTFDSLDTTQSRSSSNRGIQCEHSIANTHPFRSGGDEHRFWSGEHSVGTWRKFIRKAIKFYEVFGGLNKNINSRDFLVLS